MAKIELIMPKMGESIMEATILNWVKSEGDKVESDETILEIATDKVDSEIPSPVDGVIEKILFPVDSVVEVGKAIAIITTEEEVNETELPTVAPTDIATHEENTIAEEVKEEKKVPYVHALEEEALPARSGENFYSPLVRNIAKNEGVSLAELESIAGSGALGRVTKRDILKYLEQKAQFTDSIMNQNKNKESTYQVNAFVSESDQESNNQTENKLDSKVFASGGEDEIIQMDRMRKLIAKHMVDSKRTSAHVTSFVEADVTNIVQWREHYKSKFHKQYGEKITYTPIFIEAVVKAIKDFPLINVSVDGDNIIIKRDINIGMAAALPSGNLIVPVIHKADHLNLAGLTKTVNDLADRARNNNLKPDEISGGTFTLTNVGTFGNVMGTPIINQPQVAIMATGTIKKKPVVLETPVGDVIGIRSMMFLSLSYDHRVVDGFLGGSFLRRVADYLEGFDQDRKI